MWQQQVEALFNTQLVQWPLAAENYAALLRVKVNTVYVGGCRYIVQFNPARIASTSAKVDASSIRERKCFLCPQHLPAVQQGIPYGGRYTILVNPFPIFRRHLTIPDTQHTPQLIASRVEDMLHLAKDLSDYVITYNGPQCGASAPDHFHFQAGLKHVLPIEKEWTEGRERVAASGKAVLWKLNDTPRATLVIESAEIDSLRALFEILYQSMEVRAGSSEPMMNLLAWYETGKWVVCVFPRAAHRPSCYFAEGENHLLVSPAVIDLGGVLITPREKDFEQITAPHLHTILSEVCLSSDSLNRLTEQIKRHIQ